MTREELAGWKNLETTKEILSEIQEEIDVQIAHVIAGGHIGETADKTAMESCRIAGVVSGLSYIFNIEEDADEQ